MPRAPKGWRSAVSTLKKLRLWCRGNWDPMAKTVIAFCLRDIADELEGLGAYENNLEPHALEVHAVDVREVAAPGEAHLIRDRDER